MTERSMFLAFNLGCKKTDGFRILGKTVHGQSRWESSEYVHRWTTLAVVYK